MSTTCDDFFLLLDRWLVYDSITGMGTGTGSNGRGMHLAAVRPGTAMSGFYFRLEISDDEGERDDELLSASDFSLRPSDRLESETPLLSKPTEPGEPTDCRSD